MKVLFATSEAYPLIKTGGLADVSGSLPNALKKLKHAVRLVLPAYLDLLQKLPAKSYRCVAQIAVQGCEQTYQARILQLKAGAFSGLEVPVWLVEIPALFARPGNPYLAADGSDWWDNGERFGVFNKVVTELAMNRCGLKWAPEVVHLNDWQTGLTAALLKVEAQPPKTVFTIHNMAYPGNFPHSLFTGLGLPSHLWSMHGVEFWGHFSMLKAGLMFADWITTVSPTYAEEITLYEFAYGFEGILQQIAAEGRLIGILNGIDSLQWNPQHDALLVQNYTADKHLRSGKRKNKAALYQMLQGEPPSEAWMQAPLLGFVGRLVPQKGIDWVVQILPALLANSHANLVIVGTGEKRFEAQLQALAAEYGSRLLCFIGYSETLAHRVEAGADLFLMPSRFEPCGLNQMYSLAYGTPPIVHRTGGLADTVVDATPEALQNGLANGFVFAKASSQALRQAVDRALQLYQQAPAQWQALQKQGMQQDFSWQKSAKQYQRLYLESPNERA
ncbi:MAG: glycogen synthase GlgA [Thiotrichales bacterium]|nr:glycogen synthase GlgA [Thiotrichales bacterium]